MKKENKSETYQEPEVKVIMLGEQDVIVTSDPNEGERDDD